MFKALVKKSTAIAIVTDYAHEIEELSTPAKLIRAVALYLALQNFVNEEFPSIGMGYPRQGL